MRIIIDERRLVSGSPYKVSRRIDESRGLPSESTCVLKAEPGKFYIKMREPGILFISVPIDLLFKTALMM